MEALFGEGDDRINSRRSACRYGARGKGDKREDCYRHDQNDRVARADAEQFIFQRPPGESSRNSENAGYSRYRDEPYGMMMPNPRSTRRRPLMNAAR